MFEKFPFRANPALYEINTAAWLFDLSKRLGKTVHLGDVPSEEWDRIESWGMSYVWLMGVWSRSQEGRKVSLNSTEFRAMFETILPVCKDEDIIGSCYSISSYGPDPLIGTWLDIDRARDELHKRNMGLILDFVPNHTGVDHPWVLEAPEYYIQVSEEDYNKDHAAFFPVNYEGQTLYIAHGRDPNFPAWTDTAQLNYFNPDVRELMVGRIKEIGRHCDGIRCDMAMLVMNEVFQKVWGWTNKDQKYWMPPEEFWTQAVEKVPDLVYIAEAYWDTEYKLQQLGFDFVYDKRLYDRLRNSTPADVRGHLTADLDYQNKLVRFIENHDEMRSVMAFGKDKVKAAAALIAGLPGMKMYFHGQMEGKQIRLPIQIRQSKPDPTDPEILAFYEKLMPPFKDYVFHAGEWHLKNVYPNGEKTAENLIAYTWKLDDSLRLIIVNLSPEPAEGRIDFQDEASEIEVSELKDYKLNDRLSGQTFSSSGKQLVHPGLVLRLEGYQARIFEIEPVE
jgi:hypothetical protein